MTKRRYYDSHPDKPGYTEKDRLRRDPGSKLYSCFPTNFVRFHFGDNDFSWSLHHAVVLVLERLTWAGSDPDFTTRIEHVQRAVTVAFRATVMIQGIYSDQIYDHTHVYEGATVKVEYIDHMDTSNDNGDTVYLDCWSGELYGC